jgi:ElaB/YqjD/DUF883 family membrane-anchored ribosome-binding protein
MPDGGTKKDKPARSRKRPAAPRARAKRSRNMDEIRENVESEKDAAAKTPGSIREQAARVSEKARARVSALGEEAGRQVESFWEETKNRTRRASERVGDEWDRFSDLAEKYADEHAVGVAFGAFGLGVLLGVLVGLAARRD